MENQPVSNRGGEWQSFANMVFVHIEGYTVPQYGDMPDDQASSFTPDEIAMNMKRYLNRVGTSQRGLAEAKRDCLKLAHYACMLHAKLSEQQEGKEND
jgi:hypothetical protein